MKNIFLLFIYGACLMFGSCSKNLSKDLLSDPGLSPAADPAFQVMCMPWGIAQSGTTQMPHARRWMKSASAGNFMAFFEGDPISGNRFYGADLYNVSTGNWTSEKFPGTVRWGAGAGCDTKIAIGGGTNDSLNGSKLVHLFDIASGQWSNAQLSIGRYQLVAVGYGHKILFAGGISDSGQEKTYSRVDIYDASTNSWSIAELSNPAQLDGVAAANNTIGFTGAEKAIGYQETSLVDLYDVNSNQWSHSQLSSARIGVSGIGAGALLFFAGGWAGSTASKVCDIYNTVTKSWTHKNLAHCSGEIFTAVIGTEVLFYGDYSNTADVYDLCSKGWGSTTLNMPVPGSVAASADGKMLVGQSDMTIYKPSQFVVR